MNHGGVSNIGLGFTFSARDMASGAFGILGRNFSGLHSAITRGAPQIGAAIGAIAGSAAMLSGGLRVLRGSFDLAQQAGEFGMAIADVGSITQATAPVLRDLEQAAIDAGIATQFAPTEAAEGLRNLASNGVMATDAISALVPVLDLAAAGSVSVGDAADVSMAVLNAYGKTVDEITSVNDRLMRGTQLSALRTNEFLTIMGRAASTGNLFGNALDDVIIGLGSMRSAGLPATVATTAMGEAMRRVYTDTEAQRLMMQRFGISVKDSAGNLRSILDIASELNVAMRGMTEADRAATVMQIFHVRGMQQFNALANIQARVMRGNQVETLHGARAIAYYREQLNSAAGTTEEFRRRRLATFQGAMVLLQGTMQTLGTVIGQVFGQIFGPAVRIVTDIVNRFIQIWVSIPDSVRRTIGVITLIAGALSVFGGTLGIVVTTAVALIAILGEVLLIAAAVSAGIVAAMAPIGIAVAGVIAAGYGLYRAWQANLGGLGAFVEMWTGRIRRAWAGLEMIFTRGFFSGRALQDLLENNETGMVALLLTTERVVNNLKSLWFGFRTEFARVWQEMDQPLSELRQALDGLLGQVLQTGSAIMGQAAAIPTNEYEGFGATLARVVGGGFMVIVQAATSVINVMTRIIALLDSPTWQTFAAEAARIAEIMNTITNAATAIRGFFGGAGGYLGRFGSALLEGAAAPLYGNNPQAALEAVAAPGVAMPILRGAAVGISSPSEAAVERPPPTTQGQGRAGGMQSGELRTLLEQSLDRRPIQIRSTTTLVADGRQLAEVEETQRISRTTYGGGMYHGESQGMSVWER